MLVTSLLIPSSPVGKLPLEWVTLYIRIREMFGSKLDRDNNYPD
jgi:hypothetical protein